MLTEENIMQDSSDEDLVEDEIEVRLDGASDGYTDSLGNIEETAELTQQGAPGFYESLDDNAVEDEVEVLLVGGSDDYTDSLGSIDETVEVLGIGRDDEEKPLVIQSLQRGAPGSNESTDEDAVKDEIGVRLSGVPDCYTDSL